MQPLSFPGRRNLQIQQDKNAAKYVSFLKFFVLPLHILRIKFSCQYSQFDCKLSLIFLIFFSYFVLKGEVYILLVLWTEILSKF